MATSSGTSRRLLHLLAAVGLVGGSALPAGAQVTLQRAGTPTYTRTLPLAAPTGVTVAATRGGIAIGWQGVINAASYEIQRAPDGTSTSAAVGTAPAGAVSFLDASMSARGPAWYQVVSVAADGRRAASPRVQLVTTAIAGTATLANTATLSTATPMASATTVMSTATQLAPGPAPAPAPAPPPIDKTALGSRFASIAVGSPPTGVRAETSPTRIGIRWSCPSGATGFDVYVTPQGGAEVKLTATPVAPPCIQDVQLTQAIVPGAPAPTSTAPTYSLGYTHSGVIPGTTYTYVVRALYPNGAIAASTPLTAQANLAPAPGGFVATVSGRSAILQWRSVSGATGYSVFRKLADQTAFQEIFPRRGSTETGSSDQTLLPPGQHQYYVQALNGLPSQPASVAIPPLPAPPAFNVSSSSSEVVDLSWQLPFDLRLMPRGYDVYRQREGEASYSRLTATPMPATAYQDRGLLPGRRVTYYVRGVDADPTPSVSVVPGTVTNFCADGHRGDTMLEFSWGGTAGASAVTLLRAGTESGPFIRVTPYYSTATMARASQNPIGETQYFKLAVTYVTGVMESRVLSVTILPGVDLFTSAELPFRSCAPPQ